MRDAGEVESVESGRELERMRWSEFVDFWSMCLLRAESMCRKQTRQQSAHHGVRRGSAHYEAPRRATQP